MTTTKTESACLCPNAFAAAIEAAQEANYAGHDDQEQLAAAIVAYSRYIELFRLRPLVNASDSPGAVAVAEIHARKGGA